MNTPFRIAFIGNHSLYSPPFMRALAALPDVALVAMGSAAPGRARTAPTAAKVAARSLVNAAYAWLPAPLWQALPPRARTVARQGARLVRGQGRLVFAPNVNDPRFVAEMARARADLIIVAGLNQIFRAPAIEALPPMVNVHPSALPSYRGANPAFWQIRNGERESGVTFHYIDAGIDTGPVLAQQTFPIAAWMNSADLMTAAAEVAVTLLPQAIAAHVAKAAAVKRPVSSEPYYGFPKPDDFCLRGDFTVQGALNALRAAAPHDMLFVRVDKAFGTSPTPGRSTLLLDTATADSIKLRVAHASPRFGACDAPVRSLTYEGFDSYRLQLADGTITLRFTESPAKPAIR